MLPPPCFLMHSLEFSQTEHFTLRPHHSILVSSDRRISFYLFPSSCFLHLSGRQMIGCQRKAILHDDGKKYLMMNSNHCGLQWCCMGQIGPIICFWIHLCYFPFCHVRDSLRRYSSDVRRECIYIMAGLWGQNKWKDSQISFTYLCINTIFSFIITHKCFFFIIIILTSQPICLSIQYKCLCTASDHFVFFLTKFVDLKLSRLFRWTLRLYCHLLVWRCCLFDIHGAKWHIPVLKWFLA